MEAYLQFRVVLHEWIGFVASLGGYELFQTDRRISLFNIVVLASGMVCPFIYLWTIITCDGDLRFLAIAYYGAGIQVTVTKYIFILE